MAKFIILTRIDGANKEKIRLNTNYLIEYSDNGPGGKGAKVARVQTGGTFNVEETSSEIDSLIRNSDIS